MANKMGLLHLRILPSRNKNNQIVNLFLDHPYDHQMSKYPNLQHILVAVDCIIFGYDGVDLKIL